MRTVLSTTTSGFQTINGTDFPVLVVLARWASLSGRATFTVEVVCNGIARNTRAFRTLRDARDWYAASMSC